MPRDLFGDVVRPSATIGSRQWYTLPLSLLLHALVTAAAVIVPLMATGVLPVPGGGVVEWAQVTPVDVPRVPPPPRVGAPPRSTTAVVTNPDAAPLDAPDGVHDETGAVRSEPTSAGMDGGVPDGIVGGDTVLDATPPPPPTPPTAPIRLHSGIKAPTKVFHVSPVYPPIAQAAHIEGVVILDATISAEGAVTQVRVLRSSPLLDQAAVDAVRQWRFTPTLLNGAPVAVVMTVTVAFTLK